MTKAPKNAPITLTGAVCDRYQDVPKDDPTSWINPEPPTGGEAGELAELAGDKLAIVRVPFDRGDVALYQRSDMYGGTRSLEVT